MTYGTTQRFWVSVLCFSVLPEAWLVGPVARPEPDPQVASPKAHAWREAPSSLICLSLSSIVESRYNESTYNRGCRAPWGARPQAHAFCALKGFRYWAWLSGLGGGGMDGQTEGRMASWTHSLKESLRCDKNEGEKCNEEKRRQYNMMIWKVGDWHPAEAELAKLFPAGFASAGMTRLTNPTKDVFLSRRSKSETLLVD